MCIFFTFSQTSSDLTPSYVTIFNIPQVVGRDSMVIFSLDKEDPDVLIVVSSCRSEDGNHIVASRRFRRCQADQRQPNRRVSVI